MTVHNDASAPADPGEGHRTGTGGPDAPGASEGLDAAIEAAAEALWRHAQRGQFDKLAWADIPDHWRPEKFEQAEAAVRAAEPILPDRALAVLTRHAAESEQAAGCETCCSSRIKAAAAEIARETGARNA